MLTQFTYEGQKRQVRVRPSHPSGAMLIAECDLKTEARYPTKENRTELQVKYGVDEKAKEDFIRSIYSMANGHEGTNGDVADIRMLICLMLQGF